MHRVRRPLAAGLAGLALVAALAGCGGQPSSSGAPAPKAQPTRRPFPTIAVPDYRATQTAQETDRRLRKLECEAENAKLRADGKLVRTCY